MRLSRRPMVPIIGKDLLVSLSRAMKTSATGSPLAFKVTPMRGEATSSTQDPFSDALNNYSAIASHEFRNQPPDLPH